MLYRPKVYTASKIRHAPIWRSAESHFPSIEFTARWINFPENTPDHHTTFWSEEQKRLHWIQDVQDVQRSDFLLAYCEEGDEVKGTLVEAGCAIGLGKVVIAVGFDQHNSWQAHPLVISKLSLATAFDFIRG